MTERGLGACESPVPGFGIRRLGFGVWRAQGTIIASAF